MFERLQLAWLVLTNKNAACVVDAGRNIVNAVCKQTTSNGTFKVTFNDGSVKDVAYEVSAKQ